MKQPPGRFFKRLDIVRASDVEIATGNVRRASAAFENLAGKLEYGCAAVNDRLLDQFDFGFGKRQIAENGCEIMMAIGRHRIAAPRSMDQNFFQGRKVAFDDLSAPLLEPAH